MSTSTGNPSLVAALAISGEITVACVTPDFTAAKRSGSAPMGDQLVSHFILIAHDHHHVAARHHRVHNMSRPNEPDRNLTREHGLGGLRSDDKNRFHFHIVLAKKALL